MTSIEDRPSLAPSEDPYVLRVRREISDLDRSLVELVNKRLRLVAQRECDVVQSLQQALTREVVELEDEAAGRPVHEIDGQLLAGCRARHELLHLRRGKLHRQQADFERVLAEDVAVGRRDDRVEAVVLEGPWSVLSRRAAAEVAPREQDSRTLCFGPVELEVRILAPVEEEELAETGPLDPLEELLRDDLVRVDVRAVEHECARCERAERLHADISLSSRASAK